MGVSRSITSTKPHLVSCCGTSLKFIQCRKTPALASLRKCLCHRPKGKWKDWGERTNRYICLVRSVSVGALTPRRRVDSHTRPARRSRCPSELTYRRYTLLGAMPRDSTYQHTPEPQITKLPNRLSLPQERTLRLPPAVHSPPRPPSDLRCEDIEGPRCWKLCILRLSHTRLVKTSKRRSHKLPSFVCLSSCSFLPFIHIAASSFLPTYAPLILMRSD